MGYWLENYGTGRSREFIEGVIAGIEALFVWGSGTENIGIGNIPSEEVIRRIKEELGWKPEWDELKEQPDVQTDTRDTNTQRGTIFPEKEKNIISELTSLINRHSMENFSDTPDFILSEFLWSCLTAFNRAMLQRKIWYGNRTGEAKEILKDK